MGRVTFLSPRISLNASPQKAFTFLSNLNHMEKLMPEQVINWKSEPGYCSFDIRGMAHIDLELGELIENQLVTINSGPDNPINTQILFELNQTADNYCTCQIALNAELSMMLELLASTPLQNLVNIMSEKLRESFK